MNFIHQHIFLLLVLIASMLAIGMSNRDFQKGVQTLSFGLIHTNRPSRLHPKHDPRRIIVGGSDNWSSGVNYTEWRKKNSPFYINDTLVFKYDPPSENNTEQHSVYLLPNLRSYLRCDLKSAKLVANTTDGVEGFEFVLKQWRPHYFACGESDGYHCQSGMKFPVSPF